MKLFGASGAKSGSRGIRILSTGDIAVAGYSDRSIDGVPNTSNTQQFVIQKYSSAGNLLWTRLFGSPGFDFAMGMDIDTSDNIYVTGYCAGTVDGNINKGAHDICYVKYDTNGNKQFYGQIGGDFHDRAFALAVDNITKTFYIVGQTVSRSFDSITKLSSQDQVWLQYDRCKISRQSVWCG